MEERMTPKFTVLRRMCTLLPAIGLLTGMAVACDDDDDIVGVIPTPVVRVANNPAFNFSSLKTFSMPDTVAHFAPLTGTPLAVSRDFDRTVLDQVKANLLARGYVQAANPIQNRPDFVVLVGATATQTYDAYATYSFYPYYGYYSGWGWYTPGFTSDWTIAYPFYASVGVTTLERGTFLVTLVPTAPALAVNPLVAKQFNAEWAGSATSLLDGGATENLVKAAVDAMFAQSPYLVAAP
jgi:Domain of unknown function (DUF4136)